MDAGELVADQLLMDIVQERINRPDATAGWILDGFPRTVAQAAFFDQLLCDVSEGKYVWKGLRYQSCQFGRT